MKQRVVNRHDRDHFAAPSNDPRPLLLLSGAGGTPLTRLRPWLLVALSSACFASCFLNPGPELPRGAATSGDDGENGGGGTAGASTGTGASGGVVGGSSSGGSGGSPPDTTDGGFDGGEPGGAGGEAGDLPTGDAGPLGDAG